MDIIQIISQLGFPIASCCAMAWYVKYITDRNFTQSNELANKYVDALQEVKDALNQQTLAMENLAHNLTVGTTSTYEQLKSTLEHTSDLS